MSDLHDAVQDELAAHRPDRVPPFAAIRARKRSRDRRRLATGGAALSAVAVAAAAVLAPSFPGGGPDRLPSYAGPADGTTTTTINVRVSTTKDGDQAAVEECVGGPVGVKLSSPPVYAAALTATPEQTQAAVECLRRLPNVTSVETDKASPGPSEAVLPVPADPPGATICPDSEALGGCRAVGERAAREVAAALATAQPHEPASPRCAAMPVTYVVTFGSPEGTAKPVPYRVPARCAPVERAGARYELDHDARNTVVRLYEAAGVPPSPSAAPALPSDPGGAELCKDSTDGGGCYDLGQDQARRLAAALATGRPAPDHQCLVSPVAVYRVTWLPVSGSADPVVWTVPSAECLPMTAAGRTYDLDQESREVVASIWDGAGLYAVDATTTGKRAPSEPRQ